MSSPETASSTANQFSAVPESARSVVSSALWAAWGDAMGFITELTTSISEVSRRSGGAKVENTVPWRRQIGGRFGPMVELPAGTYSDDTQLRLAVSRSIRGNGRFDLESFSKIELPIFLSYEMRAGKGTRAAAYELMKRHVRWSTNFFENDRASYVNAGGNGAAMRIQPHVWSTPDYSPRLFMGWVAADAIVTHGHPRGVLGAVIHANALSSALRHGTVPGPEVWEQIVEFTRSVPEVMRRNEVLRERWLPAWEKAAGRRWDEAVSEVIAEGIAMVERAQQAARRPEAIEAYRELIGALGGKERETAGSGMVAAVASLFAAWAFRDDPVAGIRIIVNHLGTDTDTIATMTGALIGATDIDPPPGPILDAEYIVREAARMAAISEGEPAISFPHPDPVKWRAPRSLADAVGEVNGRLSVAGLGSIANSDGEYDIGKDRASTYQWAQLDFGQTVLIKRRREPKPLPETALTLQRPASSVPNHRAPRQAGLFDDAGTADPDVSARGRVPADLDTAVARVISSGFDESVIGRELLSFAREGLAQATAFAAAVTASYRPSR
jgi:ADP-ribosylglycohydrolase